MGVWPLFKSLIPKAPAEFYTNLVTKMRQDRKKKEGGEHNDFMTLLVKLEEKVSSKF